MLRLLGFATPVTLTACYGPIPPDPEPVPEIIIPSDSINIFNIMGRGTLRVVNKVTNDTLLCPGGFVNVGNSIYKMPVSNGDVVKMEYIADDAYKEYPFVATYTLWNGDVYRTAVGNTVYEYTVSGLSSDSYKIKWESEYTETIKEGTKQTIITISGSGNFSIVVLE